MHVRAKSVRRPKLVPPAVVYRRHVVFFVWLEENPKVAEAYLPLWKEAAMPFTALHIVMVGPEEARHKFRHLVHCADVRVESWRGSTDNQYEYPGILRVWELAQELPDDVWVGYFHNRGASRSPRLDPRNARLFQRVMGAWAEVETVSAQTCGLLPSPAGFMWFNFWWARPTYLRTVEQPQLRLDYRYYYEEWLCHSPQCEVDQCYSLAWHTTGRTGLSQDAVVLWREEKDDGPLRDPDEPVVGGDLPVPGVAAEDAAAGVATAVPDAAAVVV